MPAADKHEPLTISRLHGGRSAIADAMVTGITRKLFHQPLKTFAAASTSKPGTG